MALGKRRWLVLFALVLAVALVAPGVAFSAGEESDAGEAEAAAAPALPDERNLSTSLAEAYRSHLDQLDRRAEKLASPASVSEREHSKRAYAGLGPAEAEALLRSAFGPVLESLNG